MAIEVVEIIEGLKGDIGISISNAVLNDNGHFIVTFSNGRTKDTGVTAFVDAVNYRDQSKEYSKTSQAQAAISTNSATAASNSATAAANSSTAAATSETNAAASAATATADANSAGKSKTLAQQWAIKTDGTVDGSKYSSKYYSIQSKTNSDNSHASSEAAANSEQNASNSATNAAASAAAAKASAVSSNNSLTEATSSATAAAKSAATATTGATNASASATAAAGSATSAGASATAASTSATNSANSASASSASATAAATSAANAASAAKLYRQNSTSYSTGDVVLGADGLSKSLRIVCKTAGTTASTDPTWTAVNTTVTDGTVIWEIKNAYDLLPIINVSEAATIADYQLESCVVLSGSTTYTVTLPAPTTAGHTLLVRNAGSVAMTLSTPSGKFIGPHGSLVSTFSIPEGVIIGFLSNGTDWVIYRYEFKASTLAGYGITDAIANTGSTAISLAINSTDGGLDITVG